MNREYNNRVSSKNSERLLKNLQNTTGDYFFCRTLMPNQHHQSSVRHNSTKKINQRILIFHHIPWIKCHVPYEAYSTSKIQLTVTFYHRHLLTHWLLTTGTSWTLKQSYTQLNTNIKPAGMCLASNWSMAYVQLEMARYGSYSIWFKKCQSAVHSSSRLTNRHSSRLHESDTICRLWGAFASSYRHRLLTTTTTAIPSL